MERNAAERSGATLQYETAVHYMRQLLDANDRIPAYLPTAFTRKEHVAHCLHQLMRFAQQAEHGYQFRAVQFGLNLGRAQELLGSHGGVSIWWGAYEPLLTACDYPAIFAKIGTLLQKLDLPQPTVSFLAKL